MARRTCTLCAVQLKLCAATVSTRCTNAPAARHDVGMTRSLHPPITSPNHLAPALRERGLVVLDAAALCQLLPATNAELDALRPSWDDLPPDTYLRDGGHYRRRRHSCFIVEGDAVRRVAAPRALAAGRVQRAARRLGALVRADRRRRARRSRPGTRCCGCWRRRLSALKGAQPWYVEAHQFRIDTTDGIGRPTPEGAHRDGVDFVAVALVERARHQGRRNARVRGRRPRRPALHDGRTVDHRAARRRARDPRDARRSSRLTRDAGGHRDTLVITLRAGAFQGPEAA